MLWYRCKGHFRGFAALEPAVRVVPLENAPDLNGFVCRNRNCEFSNIQHENAALDFVLALMEGTSFLLPFVLC